MTTVLSPAEQARVDVERARWRADLLDFDAAQYDSIGHDKIAAAKRAEAVLHREHADATAKFEAAVAEHGHTSPEGRAAMLELAEHRRYWRQIHEALGTPTVQTVDNFPEPSAADLIGGN